MLRICTRLCVATRPVALLPSFFLLLLSQDDTDNHILKLQNLEHSS